MWWTDVVRGALGRGRCGWRGVVEECVVVACG